MGRREELKIFFKNIIDIIFFCFFMTKIVKHISFYLDISLNYLQPKHCSILCVNRNIEEKWLDWFSVQKLNDVENANPE